MSTPPAKEGRFISKRNLVLYSLQPQRKSNGCVIWLAVIGGIALFVAAGIFILGFLGLSASAVASISHSTPTAHEVVYKVSMDRRYTGSAIDDLDPKIRKTAGIPPVCYSFNTTYEAENGTAQKPLSVCRDDSFAVVYRRTAAQGSFVYLSVQNDQNGGPIRCEIWVDGNRQYTTQSEGAGSNASCSGSVN
jgi:hypothetical protein